MSSSLGEGKWSVKKRRLEDECYELSQTENKLQSDLGGVRKRLATARERACLAGLFSVVEEISDNISEIWLRRIILQYAEPRLHPASFELDPLASSLFERLGCYEQLDPNSYMSALHYCDKLFSLERNLSENNSAVPMAQTYAQPYVDAVLSRIMIIRNHSQNGKDCGEINNLIIETENMLSEHLVKIYSYCVKGT